jgi:multidrug efflux system outer membrane protein
VAKAVVAIAALALLGLTGCSMAPAYQPPALATLPVAYKEGGPWTPAAPADAAPRGRWWSVFADPTLDGLETELASSNQSLASAMARYDQSRALLAQARGPLLPEVDFNPGAVRTKQSEHRPLRNGGPDEYDTLNLGGLASYELDLWGRVRNLVAVAGYNAQASAADLEGVRLSLQAELASTYMALRGADAQLQLLTSAVDGYSRALDLTTARHTGGVSSGIDVGRAETQLEAARSQFQDISAQRAMYEHAIATLTGKPASQFSLPARADMAAPPQVPVDAPSLLLQRRPDIAAAERRAAAAQAYPTVTLNATGGWQTAGGTAILDTPNIFWTLGASALGPIFDNGRRKAGVTLAKDQFEQVSADYRQVVLSAFQAVEDQLVLCNRLADAAKSIDAAAAAAERTQALALTRYRLGAATYIEVVIAQTAALQSEQSSLSIRTRRLQAGVALIRAMGGGWTGA